MTPDLKQAVQHAADEYRAAEVSGANWQTRDRLMKEWGSAIERTESIDERCFRLGLMAADLDAEAERHMAAAADAAGLAAGRRLRGNDDEVARSYDREVQSCTDCALSASAEAERLRSQAASLRRAQAYARDVVSMVREAAE